ncbi:Scarecrow-like protein 32 [Apostasia shenzhenica]|uniref:Scarecrow-like protein 32 n=1 Tax=Apostasia shenzhenica TaxID=1088818 RepID=A0A2I0ARJ3_9ASPA|nr:Scarecrow-like protein 32 [Apostasia shenzhenica]
MQFKTTAKSLPCFRPSPDFLAAGKPLGSLNNSACTEQLLVHFAEAMESNDASLAQQILWVLINVAPADGNSSQRLAAAFLRALVLRASRSGSPCAALTSAMLAHCSDGGGGSISLRLSPVSLAGFIDLTPWYRFGFSAANAAIVGATGGFPVVHIVDLSTTNSMQIPTLIDALAGRPDGPPFIRLTVPCPSGGSPPPALDTSIDELGSKLVAFARSRNVEMEFRAVPANPVDGFESLLEHLRLQQGIFSGPVALVINCQMMLHYIPEEVTGSRPSARTMFLKALRSLDPTVVVVVDEDADFTAGDIVGRVRAAFNYLWIPFDAMDSILPRGSDHRRTYEAAFCWKIDNAIAQEGLKRVERLETRGMWSERMTEVGFRGVGFGVEAAAEVKSLLDGHSAGWGMKKDGEELVLTWKGNDAVFASVWV